jgi:5-methylcytosine-specific restriction endonuclease McrA
MARRIPTFRPAPTVPRCQTPRAAESRAAYLEGVAFYTGSAWRKLRRLVLSEQPLCPDCAAQGVTRPAVEVHHLVARKADAALAYERSNLVGLCNAHHLARRRRRSHA